jgi:prepilin-type N-terminal cleavage/methylation domain-containing protein
MKGKEPKRRRTPHSKEDWGEGRLNTMRNINHSSRRGFTLIELLVVISIILLLAALAVLITPSFSESHKSAMGASQLQGWLAIAKQRAYRDKLVSGVTLIRSAEDPNKVTECEYVEQPDDFRGGVLNGVAVPFGQSGQQVTIDGVPVAGSVQPGDYIEITSLNEGLNHRIVAVTPYPAPGVGATLTLASRIASNVVADPNYRIIRQQRSLANEPILKLPGDMCVDLAASPPGTPLTVLFAPWGGVEQTTTSAGKVIYWVRNKMKDSPYDGEPTLIVVYTRTGAVAAHSVNPPPGDPFLFTKDGRSSGL